MIEPPTKPILMASAGRSSRKRPPAETENDPEDGRIIALEIYNQNQDKRIDDMETQLKSIKDALFGTAEEAGICEQVRSLAKYMKGLQAVAWAIFIILAGMVLADLYAIFVSHLGMLP